MAGKTHLATQLFFILLFSALALVAQNINFSQLVGSSNQYFTFFQFIGPLPASFLGVLPGAAAILLAQLANYALLGRAIDFVGAWRLLPMLFAAYYFGRGNRIARALVPLACMAVFIAHPVGGRVWFYTLYWLIPVIALKFEHNLLARSLGATFTAHAIGGAFWIWTVPMPAEAWLALIPIVAYERGLFALGIAGSHLAFNTVLQRFETLVPASVLRVEKQYALSLSRVLSVH
ncbi:MAG: hypothetical protein QXH27_01750 [Candidatus Micrarchaeia archaeon]